MIVLTTAPADPLRGLISSQMWIDTDITIQAPSVIEGLGGETQPNAVNTVHDGEALLDLVMLIEDLGYRALITAD